MFSPRNPDDSYEEAVIVEKQIDGVQPVVLSLLASGFRLTSSDDFYHYFLPCPMGTFSNLSSKGSDGCTPCPPGTLKLPWFLRIFPPEIECSIKNARGN